MNFLKSYGINKNKKRFCCFFKFKNWISNRSPCDSSHSHQSTIQKITLRTFLRKTCVREFFTNSLSKIAWSFSLSVVYHPLKFHVNRKHEVLNPSDLAWNAPYTIYVHFLQEVWKAKKDIIFLGVKFRKDSNLRCGLHHRLHEARSAPDLILLKTCFFSSWKS